MEGSRVKSRHAPLTPLPCTFCMQFWANNLMLTSSHFFSGPFNSSWTLKEPEMNSQLKTNNPCTNICNDLTHWSCSPLSWHFHFVSKNTGRSTVIKIPFSKCHTYYKVVMVNCGGTCQKTGSQRLMIRIQTIFGLKEMLFVWVFFGKALIKYTLILGAETLWFVSHVILKHTQYEGQGRI